MSDCPRLRAPLERVTDAASIDDGPANAVTLANDPLNRNLDDLLADLLGVAPGLVEHLADLVAALGELGQAAGLPALLASADKEAGKDRDAAENAMLKLEAAATGPMIEAVAKANKADDPDWDYVVRDDSVLPGLVRVAVLDEDGTELGSL